MINYIKNCSIFTKLLMAFSTLIVIPIFVNTAVTYMKTVNFIEEKSVLYEKEITRQINTTLDNYLKNADSLSIQAAYNELMLDILQKNYDNSTNSTFEKSRDSETAARYLQRIRKTLHGIGNIFIYNTRDEGYFGFVTGSVNTNYSIRNESWYSTVKASNGEVLIIGPYEERQIDLKQKPIISVTRKILDHNKFKEIGIIVVEINIDDVFNELLNNIGVDSKNSIYIVNEEGKVVFDNIEGSKAEKFFSPVVFGMVSHYQSGNAISKINGIQTLITHNKSDYTGWTVISLTDRNNLIQGIEIIKNNSIINGLILIIIALVISVLISNGIVKPINRLKKMISYIENGDFDYKIKSETKDEIGMLSQSFNVMTGKLKEMMWMNALKEQEKRKAEMVALQAQINPHFIYNTLYSVRQLAEIQKSSGITGMVDALIKLLQASVKNHNRMITVEEEINMLKSYIYIQETRYLGKFLVDFIYNEDVLQYKTLSLVLQPIVENAIFHGIRSKKGLGHILIKILIEEDHMLYIVEDDGVGIEKEKLGKILLIENDSEDYYERLGVFNVNKRIKLNFGDAYSVTIESNPNKGTKVKIKVPLMK